MGKTGKIRNRIQERGSGEVHINEREKRIENKRNEIGWKRKGEVVAKRIRKDDE